MASSPEFAYQRRFRATDRFVCQVSYCLDRPNRLQLGCVIHADGSARSLLGKRAFLELRQHFARKVVILQKFHDGLGFEAVPGSEQEATILRHAFAWIELSEPVDRSKSNYAAVWFD